MKKISVVNFTVIAMLSFCVGSCKKKDSTPTPAPVTPATTPPSTTLTSNYYFQATINGTVVTFQDGIGGYSSGAADESGTTTAGYQEVQSGELTIPLSSKLIGGFDIIKTDTSYLTTGTDPDSTFINAMFSVKSYSYGKQHSGSDAGTDGARVFYIDNDGVMWASDYGTGSQTNSTFSITEHIAKVEASIHHISKATFSCTLYNSSGSTMTLTNGVCRSRTVLY